MSEGTVHTYPVDDLIDHETDGGDCICGPTVEAVFRRDGTNGWHVTHHSLDGREQSEAEELRRRLAADDGTRHDLDDVITELDDGDG